MLANTCNYLVVNLSKLLSNINIKEVSNGDIDLIESAIEGDENYILYFCLLIKFQKGYNYKYTKYKKLKWIDDFIALLTAKYGNTEIIDFNYNSKISIDNTIKVEINV